MLNRLVLKYVLTRQGYDKIANALDKEGIPTNNRVQWIVDQTEIFGSKVGKDKIRDIIVKRIAVKQSLIEALFKSLRLDGEIEVDWVLSQQEEIESQRILQDGKNHKSLICDLAQSDRPQPPTNPQNIPTPESIPELTTLEFIGRDRDRPLIFSEGETLALDQPDLVVKKVSE